MKTLKFAHNDLLTVRRDSLLFFMLLMPWLMSIFIRLVVPPMTEWLQINYSFDLTPYYALIVSFFIILEIPLIFGVVMGLLVLDERDDQTLLALQVTPVSLKSYGLYRVATAIVLSIVFTFISLPITGINTAPLLAMLPVLALGSTFAVIIAMVLITFADNKLEGLAIMKAFGLLMLGPLAGYFIESNWQLALGILPSYWPAKAYWLLSAGHSAWPYVLAGTVYNVLLITALYNRFKQKVFA